MRKFAVLAFILSLILICIFLLHTYTTCDYQYVSSQSIKNFLLNFGVIKASFIYVFIYTFTIRPFIPVSPTLYTITGGLVFGPYLGTMLSVTGATLNASLTFIFARFLAKRFVEKLLSEKTESINRLLSKNDFKTILLIRSVPIGPPFDMVSYAAGLFNVPLYKFVLATLTGIIPATFVFSYFGDSISDGNLIILFGFILFVIFSFFIPRLLRGKTYKI